jgi:hypothetical protein
MLQIVRKPSVPVPRPVAPLAGSLQDSARIDPSSLAATNPVAPVVPSPAPAASVKTVRRPADTGSSAGAIVEAADTLVPSLNALESPTERAWAVPRAMRVLRARFAPPHKRAEAAAFLGAAALDAGKRDTALALFRLAYRLDHRPNYLRLIQQFGDTIRP